MQSYLSRLVVGGGLLTLAGCATFSPDGGMEPVAKFTRAELGKDVSVYRTESEAAAAQAIVAKLLKQPLTADSAVRIALLNNRGLQAAFAELGIAEAAMVGASLPPNPSFSLARLAGNAEIEIERRIVANILDLATLPIRADVAKDRFRQAQLRAIGETMRTAVEARQAWYRAVATRETVGFLEQAQTAAGTAAKLARRLGESGAMNKLDQAREQVFYADIGTQVAAARQRAVRERESLARVLGLWGRNLNFRLPARLPAPPARPRMQRAIEVDAIRRRIDLQIARLDLDALAKSYSLTEATRFIDLLEVAGHSKTTRPDEGATTRQRGIEIEFQIPIFDFGEVRVREAEATYRQAVNRLIEKAVNVRSQAREAYQGYRAAWDIARHYQQEVVPLRRIISEETLLRYNAMQIDVFSLLSEARQRVAANVSAIEARRDFWLADTNLHMVIAGTGPGAADGDAPATAVASAEPAGH